MSPTKTLFAGMCAGATEAVIAVAPMETIKVRSHTMYAVLMAVFRLSSSTTKHQKTLNSSLSGMGSA